MLQGSLDDFALVEILGLLAETSKSGQLDIKGDRGSGALIFAEGRLSEARASKCDSGATAEDVMFELLRYSEGSFVFSNKEVAANGGEKNVSGVLSVAESRLADWQAIAEVVPTLRHIVYPSPELPEDEVMINRTEWGVLGVVASEAEVATVCDELKLGEVEGSRTVKHLIERGLVSLRDPAAPKYQKRVSQRPTAQAEDPAAIGKSNPKEPKSVPEKDSLVSSLRSGSSADPAPSAPVAAVPPLPGSENSKGEPDAAFGEKSTEGGGLLMRYLKGEED